MDHIPTLSHIDIMTETEKIQKTTEKDVTNQFNVRNRTNPFWQIDIKMKRNNHIAYCLSGLEYLASGFVSLDASKPWLCYWILHSLELLDSLPNTQVIKRVVDYLGRCQDPKGGFCGGPGQIPHLAATYAAINALVICGTKEAYDIIDRKGLYQFLMKMKNPNASFCMHELGETDVRGSYCALVVASLTGILTPELIEGTAEWIASCQTYEGGIAAVPFNEAHGGYTFCGYAALVLLNKSDLVDKRALLKFCASSQLKVEGGFNGRSNKLVDGCYSFWQGGIFPLLDMTLINKNMYCQIITDEEVEEGSKHTIFAPFEEGWCFDQSSLQKYLIGACEDKNGGMMDKPGKGRDYYHTCYCLSGLSVAQNNPFYHHNPTHVLGDESNVLEPTHPIYNIGPHKVYKAITYFENLPFQ